MAVDMLSMLFVVLYFTFPVTVVAQSSLSIVCVAGQCLQGYSNTTIGATLSAPGTPRMQLLPGQYTRTTNPQLLHNVLTSPSSSLVGSLGFRSASLSSLPLDLQMEPGVAIYSQSLYSGQASFAKLPESPVSNTSSIPMTSNSIAIAPNIWIAVSNNNNRLILWDSVPDTSQLPSTGSMSLLDVQSSNCSPPCSGPSVCSVSGSCTCPSGFTGSSCESCKDGFFGPTCQPCPDGCSNCDQGMSGSGRCLTPITNPDNLPAKCNCLNGVCGSNGQCTCNSGWTTGNNGTACAKCATGFFLTTTGDCQVCQLGCVQCTDGTGDCVTCKPGFTQDANDRTKCTRVPTRTVDPPCLADTACVSSVPCPDGSFTENGACKPCSPSCLTCTGPTSNDCTLCATGTYFFNGNCVRADSNGVCLGTNGMVANNNKFTCDTCGAKCTSCRIPNFNSASTIDLLQCTACLPGFFLFQGKCIAGCSAGTFASQDNSCTSCTSSCSTCAGSPDFCLTCPSGQFASSGKCISSCPSDTFSSSGSCVKCHPDCSTCSGASFNQCRSCPPSRPVLINGRCLPTCSRSQYFDSSALRCQACDASCSSCSGPGSRNCLGCSNSNQVLRGGSCVSANCQGSGSFIPSLGVCLSDLVEVPSPSGTGTPSPLPTIPGLTDPTTTTATPHIKLTWWQILLMTLGCAFILVVLFWFWRRRARKHREKKTKNFAREKNLDGVHGWLVRLGRRLFGGKKDDPSELPMAYASESLYSPKIRPIEHDVLLRQLAPPNSEAKARSRPGERDSMDELLSAYERTVVSRATSASSGISRHRNEYPGRLNGRTDRSLYSEVTGKQRWTSDPRESLHKDPVTLRDSIGSSIFVPTPPTKPVTNREGVPADYNPGYQAARPVPDWQMSSTGNQSNLTDAQAYMQAVRPMISGEMGFSTQGQATSSAYPIPTYTVAPTFARPMGPTSLGAVPQLTRENRVPMPESSTGYGQPFLQHRVPIPGSLRGHGQDSQPPVSSQPPFMVSSGTNVLSQPMHTGGSYSSVSDRNPFRNRGS